MNTREEKAEEYSKNYYCSDMKFHNDTGFGCNAVKEAYLAGMKETENNISVDDFTVVCWPEIQELMDLPDFESNSHLINDESGLDEYGSSAYFVRKKWLKSLETA